jgi:NAD(P)-dependent dehydrogenase (short-subunit alcohol dehydrogenase family)
MVGRRLAPLRETEALLESFGVETLVTTCDVSEADQVSRLREQVAARWPALKTLVNNAGANVNGDLSTLSFESWNAVLSSQLSSVFLMTKTFLPMLLAAERPSVVNMASIGGLMGLRGRPAYAAAKGGVLSITRQLAIEYGAQGLRVNAISPGTTDKAAGAVRDPQWEAVRHGLIASIPLGRTATPREIANAIAFMASDAASFMHGANVVVDGGRTVI